MEKKEDSCGTLPHAAARGEAETENRAAAVVPQEGSNSVTDLEKPARGMEGVSRTAADSREVCSIKASLH